MEGEAAPLDAQRPFRDRHVGRVLPVGETWTVECLGEGLLLAERDRGTLFRLCCPGSQLPGYLRVGDQTLGHLHLVRLDLVESEQMLGSFW
jgi:hypothetical protein